MLGPGLVVYNAVANDMCMAQRSGLEGLMPVNKNVLEEFVSRMISIWQIANRFFTVNGLKIIDSSGQAVILDDNYNKSIKEMRAWLAIQRSNNELLQTNWNRQSTPAPSSFQIIDVAIDQFESNKLEVETLNTLGSVYEEISNLSFNDSGGFKRSARQVADTFSRGLERFKKEAKDAIKRGEDAVNGRGASTNAQASQTWEAIYALTDIVERISDERQ